MVRVTQLVETGHWFDDTIARSNAPYGERLHWTRPLDVLLIAGAAPLATFTGWERALWLWGVSLSPTLLAAAAVVFALGLGLRREEHALLAVLLVMCQPALMHQCAAARPDHHSLLVFCAVLAAVLARRAMMRRFAHATAVYAGLACALGVWVSVEFLPLAAWVCGGTAIVGILHGTWAMDRTRRMAWGLAVGLLAAVLIEHPPHRWNHGLPDQIGLHHAGVALAAAAAMEAAWHIQRRLRWGLPGRAALHAAAAGPAIALAAWAWPSLVADPFGYLPQELRRNWLDHVGDLQPLSTLASPSWMALGIWLFALPVLTAWAVWNLGRSRRLRAALPRSPISLWWLVGGVSMAAMAWTCFRWTTYAEICLLPPLLLAAIRFRHRCRPRPGRPSLLPLLARTGGTLILACGFLAFTPWSTAWKITPPQASGSSWSDASGTTNVQAAEDRRPPARLAEAAAWVRTQPDWDNAIVLAPIDDGPEWLYRTRARVIASPYHRNIRGILDSHAAMAHMAPEEARAWIQERGIDFIVWRTEPGAAQFWSVGADPEALYPRMQRGQAPSWLEPVELPAHLAGRIRIYRVLPQQPAPPSGVGFR
jgi:hypothetical protein